MNNKVTRIDEWRPNWSRECEVCGRAPCVQGWVFDFSPDAASDKLAYNGTMCGACTWGLSECADPENW